MAWGLFVKHDAGQTRN